DEPVRARAVAGGGEGAPVPFQVQAARPVGGTGGPPRLRGVHRDRGVVRDHRQAAQRAGEAVVLGEVKGTDRGVHGTGTGRRAASTSERCSSRASPSSPRRRRSSPATGTRFCGARGSLYAVEANRGSVTADRSASSTARFTGRSAAHSTRTTPAHGPPPVPGSRRYQACRRHRLPRSNTGLRWPGRSAVTTVDSSLGRYSTRCVLT